MMVSIELNSYIQKARAQGISNAAIVASLRSVGWQEPVIAEAIGTTYQPQQPSTKEPAVIYDNIDPAGGFVNRIYSYLKELALGKRRFRTALFGFLIAVFFSAYPSYVFLQNALPIAANLNEKVNKAIDEVFPEDLTITIKKGEASTNVTEPYYLTISKQTLEELFQQSHIVSQSQSKFRLISLNTTGSIEDFERQQSYAMLTKKNLVYMDDGETKIQSLSSVPDMMITRNYMHEFIEKFNKDNKIVNLATRMLYTSPAFIVLFSWMWFIVEVLTATFILWIFNTIHTTKLRYSKLFGVAGVMYVIPSFLLSSVKAIGWIQLYAWLYIVCDVIVIVLFYLFITRYRDELHEEETP
ncbi:DUF1189 family protein [Candidatus Roizmanbacteria bacterium]|nr:DUF1189 family protein [Candidatus Roizmanbacteria bacterium]